MKKTLHFLKIYIGIEKRAYLVQMIENLILIIALLFAIGEYNNIRQQKQIMVDLNSDKLVRVDSVGINEEQLGLYVETFDRYIQSKADIIAIYKKTVYTTEWYHGERIILDIKERDFIENINLKTSKGNWFSPDWEKEDVLQAVVPKTLSNKYNMGKQYLINIDSLSSQLSSVSIEVVGVLENDFVYDMSSGDYLMSDNLIILIYDSKQLFDLNYYNAMKDAYSFLIKLDKDVTYEMFMNLVKDYSGVINIISIENSFTKQLEMHNPNIVLPTVMAITIFVLLMVFIISKNLLDYINNHEKLCLFLRLGSNYLEFIKIFVVLTIGMTFIPLFIGYFVSIIGNRINLYYYDSFHIFYVGIIILSIYILTYTIVFKRIVRLDKKQKIKIFD